MSSKVLWEPQPGPQTLLLQCPVFEVFFGGARGGGKTESSIGDWLDHSNTYGEHANGLFVRRKLTQLSDVIARTKQIFPKLGARYLKQEKTWIMANGARLRFAYLENDSDAEEYQGHSYTRIYVEEVTNFPSPAPIQKLKATLRSGAGVPVGMRLTGNPGGPGHLWVKARYITPNPAGFQVITETETFELDGEKISVSIDRVFIPSRLGDNPLLVRADPTYILRLRQTGSDALVRAWLEGNWDIVDGAYFEQWDESKHVVSRKLIKFAPPSALRFRAFDWGSAKPFSVGWYVVADGTWGNLPKDALLKYREWYGAKAPNVGLGMTAEQVQKGILEMEMDERISYGVADPSIFIRNGGPSIADAMFKCRWRRADNKRLPGWQRLRHGLVGRDGRPLLYFSEDCEDSIRTIPALQHDETNPEDIDTDGEDHAGDETRYAIMSRPWADFTTKDIVNTSRPMTINELVQFNQNSRKQKALADGLC